MLIEGIIGSLIASSIGAVFIYIAGKLLHDWFYVEIHIPNKKDTKEIEYSGDGKEAENKHEKKKNIKIYRRFPWSHAYKYAEETKKKLRGESKTKNARDLYEPTIIIGIGRGGAIYGSIFSYYMKETPLLSLDRKYLYDDQGQRIGEDWYYPIDIPKELLQKVLLVAGEYHTGKTMMKFIERLKEIGAVEIRSCVLYYQTNIPDQQGAPNYYGIIGKHDCLMPWQEKQFLRTWKDSNDEKVREYTLKNVVFENLKNGFFIMRHAQTDANAADIFIGSGSPNESINAAGVLEAKRVGVFLKENIGKLDVIYSSPLKRCIQTATEIRNEVGGEIITDPRLLEVNYGEWEGVKRCEIPTKELKSYVNNQTYKIPGSTDSYSDNKARAKAFLADLIQHHIAGKRVLVVTHKSIGRIMVQAIEKKEHLHYRSIPMDNASLRKVVVKDGEMSIPYYIAVLNP